MAGEHETLKVNHKDLSKEHSLVTKEKEKMEQMYNNVDMDEIHN